jgi:hypothetical protein
MTDWNNEAGRRDPYVRQLATVAELHRLIDTDVIKAGIMLAAHTRIAHSVS